MIERNGEMHRFLHGVLASEEALDIILFLAGHADRDWSADEIRTELHIAHDSTPAAAAVVKRRIELRLEHLWERGLVRQMRGTGRYRFETSDRAARKLVSDLAGFGPDDRTEAARLIYVRPRSKNGGPV